MPRRPGKWAFPPQVLPGWNIPRIICRLEELIRTEHFQIIHCHGSRANLMGYLLKKRVQAPVVTTIHSDPKLDYLGRPLSNLTYGAANRAALRHLDDWICVSRQLRDMMVEAGVDPRAAFVINNGVDFSHIHAPCGERGFLEGPWAAGGAGLCGVWHRGPDFTGEGHWLPDPGLCRCRFPGARHSPGHCRRRRAAQGAGAAGGQALPGRDGGLFGLAHGYGQLLQRLGCEYADLPVRGPTLRHSRGRADALCHHLHPRGGGFLAL